MRRIMAAGLAGMLMATWMGTAAAETYYVRAGGNDQADGKSAKTAFRTVLRAARMLNHGDGIVIGPGTYRESVLIAERFGTPDAPLAIVGDESGKRSGDAAGAVVIESAVPGEAALWIHRSQHVRVAGLTIRGPGEGIRLEKVRVGLVERCTFDRLSKAVSATDSEDVRVESSVISRGVIGITLRNAVRTRLAHLTLASCSGAGILLASSPNGAVRNCVLVDNATAMAADNASAPTWSSDYNTICGTVGSWGLTPLCRIVYEWHAASGQERHSNYVPPAFADTVAYDLHLDPAVSWGGGLPGMDAGIALDPPVSADRDGQPFRARQGRVCTGAYDYPDPKAGGGWTKLAVEVADGVRHSAAIVAKSGELMRTLLADAGGVAGLWWDGRDDTGRVLEPGSFEVRQIAHDVRLLDDGALGDNGNPMGTFNCDNAQRVVVYPDGSFVISTIYDEAGIPLRFHASSGQPVSGSALSRANVWAIALEGKGKSFVAGVGREIWRIVPPGERAKMPSGAPSYPILGAGEALAKGEDGKTDQPFGGVAVAGDRVLVTVPLAGGNVVRVMEMATGRKIADWPVAAAGDIDADAGGNVWLLSGQEVLCLNAEGRIARQFKVEIPGSYLAVGKGRLAVVSAARARIAILDMADGRTIRLLGQDRSVGKWLPPSGNLFSALRDAAFLPDGQLLVCQAGRIRVINTETAQETLVIHSNFMDALVPHPKNPEILYCHRANIFRLDHRTGAWDMVRESPGAVAEDLSLGQCMTAGMVQGRPYLLVQSHDSRPVTEEEKKAISYIPRRYTFLDISDPLAPKYAGSLRHLHGFTYADARWDKDGNLCWPEVGNRMRVVVNKLLGRDDQGLLHYADLGGYGKPSHPLDMRGAPGTNEVLQGMFQKGGLTFDLRNNDAYLMACTPLNNKMVPAWGASATGIGKLTADGRAVWFTPSSGGNYTSLSSAFDGKEFWILAGKDFGGQVDVFTADGLRLTTGNWGWGMHWTSGFVDLREGVQAYIRPDGKPGAHVEDDNIGRFGRYRLDGGETVKRTVTPLAWAGAEGAPVATDVVPSPHEVEGKAICNTVKVPRVKDLPVDGDWAKWAAAGVTPQIVSLPIVAWGRVFPPDLLQNFRAGTSIGAVAHDGASVYVYFLTTDDTPQFHAQESGANMWEFDSIELWLEEEQFGLGFNEAGQPRLFKYRYHNREGKEWSANYALPTGSVWGAQLASVADHPLGALLGSALGASLAGKPGYALMAKIPMEEIKLVGGITGRKGGQILPMKGEPGETMRVGIAFDGTLVWGRSQDFKVYWPIGLMFSDPTSNIPFVLE